MIIDFSPYSDLVLDSSCKYVLGSSNGDLHYQELNVSAVNIVDAIKKIDNSWPSFRADGLVYESIEKAVFFDIDGNVSSVLLEIKNNQKSSVVLMDVYYGIWKYVCSNGEISSIQNEYIRVKDKTTQRLNGIFVKKIKSDGKKWYSFSIYEVKPLDEEDFLTYIFQ